MEQRKYQLLSLLYSNLMKIHSLRLQMYKGMGFEPVMDKKGTISKMLVRESY